MLFLYFNLIFRETNIEIETHKFTYRLSIKWTAIIGVLSFGILVPTFFVPLDLGSIEHLIAIGIAIITSFVVWEGSKYVQSIVSYYFPWDKSIVAHLAYELLFIFILSALGLVIGIFSYAILVESLDEITLGVVLQNVFVSFVLALLFTAINEGQFLFRKWKASLVEQERLTQEVKIESLKKQLDPHFLFNSLSVLSGVIHHDIDLADEFITKMSKVYRYAIEHNEQQTVSLYQELQFADAYHFLLKVRFPEKINLELDFPNQQSIDILPLTFQLLIENAVKHNSMTNPLTIRAFTEGDFIIVENNINERTDHISSTKIGLKNLDARYKILTGEGINIKKTEGVFRIEIPIITKP